MNERIKCISLNISTKDWQRLCKLLEARKQPMAQWLRSLLSAEMERMEGEEPERHAMVSMAGARVPFGDTGLSNQ